MGSLIIEEEKSLGIIISNILNQFSTSNMLVTKQWIWIYVKMTFSDMMYTFESIDKIHVCLYYL